MLMNIPQLVKDSFKRDGVLKNIRISFPNGEFGDICNDRLIKESLKFNESLSSREQMKFGLSEASQLSFECVDVENIKGMEIDAAIEIDVTDARIIHPVQKECPVFLAITIESETYYVIVSDFPELEAGHSYNTDDGAQLYYEASASGDDTRITMTALNYDHYASVTGTRTLMPNKIYFYSTQEGKFYGGCNTGWMSSEHFQLYFTVGSAFTDDDWLEAIHDIKYDPVKKAYYERDFEPQTADDVPFPFFSIPLGRFIVDECKRDAGMMRRKVVAYSKNYDDYANPRYLSTKTNLSEITLEVINFLIATSKRKLFNTDNFGYSDIVLDFNDSSRFTASGAWYYQGVSKRLRARVVFKFAERSEINNAPDMHFLVRCDNNGISNYQVSDIEANMEYISQYIESSGYIDDEHREWIYKTMDKCNNLIRNMIRPMPYTDGNPDVGDGAPINFLNGINVGDIYPAPHYFFFVTEVYIGLESDDVEEVGYTFTNSQTEDVVSYKLVNTYMPQEFLRIKGNPTDTEGYYDYGTYFSDIDYRNLLESYLEAIGVFGRMGRDGYLFFFTFAPVQISGLFPNPDLIPSNDIYPTPFTRITTDTNTMAVVGDECVSSLWYEEYFVAYGRIKCDYQSSEILDENNNPTTQTYIKEWNDDPRYLTYEVSGNEIVDNRAYTEAQLETWLSGLFMEIPSIKFYPSELSCVGLPYIEAGDWVLASYHGNQVLTLNLSRTLDGIQAMRDKMKSD